MRSRERKGARSDLTHPPSLFHDLSLSLSPSPLPPPTHTLLTPYPDYTGGCDSDAAKKYFTDRFIALNKSESKEIYHHVTCATDTKNVKIVFNSCKDIILKSNLKGSGFMD